MHGLPEPVRGRLEDREPEKKLVGRAVTLLLMPLRPEVADVDSTRASPPMGPGSADHASNRAQLVAEGRRDRGRCARHFGRHHRRQPGGTTSQDVGAGFVIDGMIRDLDGIKEIDMTGYYREAVPPALTNCMVAGINSR